MNLWSLVQYFFLSSLSSEKEAQGTDELQELFGRTELTTKEETWGFLEISTGSETPHRENLLDNP